jgi:hypothetical protein
MVHNSPQATAVTISPACVKYKSIIFLGPIYNIIVLNSSFMSIEDHVRQC